MYEIEALGTHWWIECLDDGELSDDVRRLLDSKICQFENDYSRFNENSLISKLSRYGRIDNPPAEMTDMLDFGRRMNIMTDGVFNPLIGTKLQSIGYGGISSQILKVEDFATNVSWDSRRIISKKGQLIDIGGFGKGWLIDKLAVILQDHGVERFVINGGGDLYVQSDRMIQLALEDPYDNTKSIGAISLQKGALAASSVLKRTWSRGDKWHHHIIDPRSSESTDGSIVASFIVAENALLADSLATVLIIKPELEAKLSKEFNIQVKLIAKS